MKATFWIGCILIILLSCTGLCMATDVVENGTEIIVETVNNTTADIVVINETVNETPVSTIVEANVSEPATPEVMPTQEVEAANITEEMASNTTPVTVEEAAEVNLPVQKKEELAAFVNDVRMIALKAGKDAAISAFNDRMGPYANPDMPVFAFDSTGKVLANPMDLASVGTNQISASDSEGTRYVQMMIDTAKNGQGYIEYMGSNILEQGKVMKRMVYISSVDGSWFIGSGYYLTDDAQQEEPITKEITPAVNETTENPAASV